MLYVFLIYLHLGFKKRLGEYINSYVANTQLNHCSSILCETKSVSGEEEEEYENER